MKYPWDKMTEQQKIKACQEEIDLVTHNGTTKDDLLNILRWLWNKFEVVKDSEFETTDKITASECIDCQCSDDGDERDLNTT